MEGKHQVVQRVYQAGKVAMNIDITSELESNDPYWACAQKLTEWLDIQKLEIVEAVTNKAIFGKEVTS